MKNHAHRAATGAAFAIVAAGLLCTIPATGAFAASPTAHSIEVRADSGDGADLTDAPTDSPTDTPTDAPTDTPTDTPTDAPTDRPAPSPSPSVATGTGGGSGGSTERPAYSGSSSSGHNSASDSDRYPIVAG